MEGVHDAYRLWAAFGPRQVQLAREMHDSGELTVQQIADDFGVTRPTIYRHLSKVPSQTQTPA
ncbi:helix-turn-helix domain-containing protein [Streptomyces sp. NPDC056231]|uniref:helix-turn-helix domain-containing protein n=1 Tax=Streptomyces sp. NPDC056231 TaxID=3345755 RepID=UPI003AAD4156